MMFWNQKKLLEQKDEIIELYKQREQQYQSELAQKNKIILEYQEKEGAYISDLQSKQRLIQELQNKVREYEQRLIDYQKMKKEPSEKSNQQARAVHVGKKQKYVTMSNYGIQQELGANPPNVYPNFQTMQKLAQMLSNQKPHDYLLQQNQLSTNKTSAYGSNRSSFKTTPFHPYKMG